MCDNIIYNNNFYKRWEIMKIILSILIVVFVFIGCSSTLSPNDAKELSDEQKKLINEMKENSYSDGYYNVYVIFGRIEGFDHNEVEKEIAQYIAGEFQGKNSNVKGLSVYDRELGEEYIDVLGLGETTTFLILDNKGLVLQTTDFEEFKQFFE
jgi:uncharacterized protein YceK